ASQKPELAALVSEYQAQLKTVQETTLMLGGALQKGQVTEALANSALYLDMMGKTIIGWLWLEMADKALAAFANSPVQEEQQFLAGKCQAARPEEHTSELQSRENLVCRLLLEKNHQH